MSLASSVEIYDLRHLSELTVDTFWIRDHCYNYYNSNRIIQEDPLSQGHRVSYDKLVKKVKNMTFTLFLDGHVMSFSKYILVRLVYTQP